MASRHNMAAHVPAAAVLLATLASLAAAISTYSGQPHIIFIMADDMGWNDVGFHGSSQIPTPNIDALCYNGIILNNYYTQPTCTPSRSALMTGKYPIRTGMQGQPLKNSQRTGLPLHETLLPERLRSLGYRTRAVGKWHLGQSRYGQLPTRRGFETHYGYWGGFISYYDHVLQESIDERNIFGFDLHRNLSSSWEDAGTYATDLFTKEAVNVISDHDNRTPLFLYLSHLAPHAGNAGKILEAPNERVQRLSHIVDVNRRTYAAMVSKLDDSVGKVVKALKEHNMLDNSIVVFLSDNGAPTVGLHPNWGSNWPFRGLKETLWEGGLRVPACMWNLNLRDTPRVSHDLMHVTDWLPTLLSAAGGFPATLPYNTDGKDMWLSLLDNRQSPRVELLHNIDEKERVAAYRRGGWKLVLGQYKGGDYDAYYGEDGTWNKHFIPYDLREVVVSDTSRAISTVARATTTGEMAVLRDSATIRCPWTNSSSCISKPGRTCLFDIEADPCEQTDLSQLYPHQVRRLKQALAFFKTSLVPQIDRTSDPNADPRRFNFTFQPWVYGCGVDCVA